MTKFEPYVDTYCKACWVITRWWWADNGNYKCEKCGRIKPLRITVRHE